MVWLEKGQLFLSIFHIHGFHTSVFFPFHLYLVIFKEIHQMYLSTLLAEEKKNNNLQPSRVQRCCLYLHGQECLTLPPLIPLFDKSWIYYMN